MVFRWESFDEEGCFNMCRFDLTRWVKAEWGELIPLVTNIIRSPESVELSQKSKKNKINWVRTPLAFDFIKVNVDGSYLGSSGKSGIGGVFKDSDENVFLHLGRRCRLIR